MSLKLITLCLVFSMGLAYNVEDVGERNYRGDSHLESYAKTPNNYYDKDMSYKKMKSYDELSDMHDRYNKHNDYNSYSNNKYRAGSEAYDNYSKHSKGQYNNKIDYNSSNNYEKNHMDSYDSNNSYNKVGNKEYHKYDNRYAKKLDNSYSDQYQATAISSQHESKGKWRDLLCDKLGYDNVKSNNPY